MPGGMTNQRIGEIYTGSQPTWQEAKLLAEMAHAYGKAMQGKTLRDEFAMAALRSMVFESGTPAQFIAEVAYSTADAMMKAREK